MKIIFKKILTGNPSGFGLPTVLFLVMILSSVAYATLLQSNNSLNLAYKQGYLQIARVASKSAIDYAQEQFDNSICGDYTGTPEKDLVSNGHYRVTIKAEVLNTSADGFEKTIKGTGSVYLPKQSETAKYVFDVQADIVRTYATCKTPADFAPILWLDANNTSSLKTTTQTTDAITPRPTTGQSFWDIFMPNDTVEEKVSDGTQGLLSWLSDDVEMHTCDGWEFAFFMCYTRNQRDLYTGLVFKNMDIPQNATINTATIQFVGASPSGGGGDETHRIYGLYKSTTNPHLGMFSSFGVNQVKTPITTTGLHTSSLKDIVSNNFSPGNTMNFDVKNVVQEMVNNPNWGSTGPSNDWRMGFGIYRIAGDGNRKVKKDGISLNVSYSTSTISQTSNQQSLTEWDDLSGNGNHAKFAYGNQPTRQDNQINGKTVVRFNNGTLLSSLATALQGKRELTVLAVVKPSFSTSNNNGRIVSGMSSSGTNDTSGSDGIIPLFRDESKSGFSSNYSGAISAFRTDFVCGSDCDDRPYAFVSKFSIDNPITDILETLRGNGSEVATKNGISPPVNPTPYKFNIDQLYIGGRRDGTLASGTGTDYLNGDYAEIIVYDKALTCRQIESLEDYLRSKWGLSATAYTDTCPANVIPLL